MTKRPMDPRSLALERLTTFVSKPFVALGTADEIDAIMDLRDRPRFAAQWMRVYASVESASESNPPDAGSIPREAFLRAFEANGHHDLAAQVSDDLQLLAEALLTGLEDPWLNALWRAYAAGEFPHETLRPVRGCLADIIVDRREDREANDGPARSRARKGKKKRAREAKKKTKKA